MTTPVLLRAMDGDHRGTSTFLTCVHPNKHESDVRIGISMDQILANHYAEQTRFASLEIGCEGGGNAGSCDSGYSCAYSRNISWQDERTPLPKETNPRLLFQRLFGGYDPNADAAARARQLRRRTSVLDFVLEDAAAIRRQLSATDHHRMDAYMDGIRGIETRLQAAENEDMVCAPTLETPAGTPRNRAEYAQLMLDILVQAMRCDLTRVGTFMFGNEAVTEPMQSRHPRRAHELSHHKAAPPRWTRLLRSTSEISILLHLLNQMDSIDMGGRSLLDETTVYFSCEIEDGNRHFHYNLPIIMAGRAGGLQTGRFVDVRGENNNNEPVANLFMRILEDAGTPVERFGDDGDRSLQI